MTAGLAAFGPDVLTGAAMSKRVLICDDSLLMRRMVAETLKDAGWEIAGEAADGQQAIEQFRQSRPDAVTMDVVMPDYDGIYGLTGIREVDPNAKVVMVSALNQTKLIAEAIRRGAYDFIAKPFMPEQLQETMESCVS